MTEARKARKSQKPERPNSANSPRENVKENLSPVILPDENIAW